MNLTVQGGLAFAYSVFLNGVFLGSGGSDPSLSLSTDVWTFPEGAVRVGKDNVLTVLQGKLKVVCEILGRLTNYMCAIDHMGYVADVVFLISFC